MEKIVKTITPYFTKLQFSYDFHPFGSDPVPYLDAGLRSYLGKKKQKMIFVTKTGVFG